MIEYFAGLLIIIVIFSFIFREGFLYRAAEALLVSVSISLLVWSGYKYFLQPQFVIATYEPYRFLWFVLGAFIVLGELPAFKRFSLLSTNIFVGLGIGIFLTGVVQGFIFPQIASIFSWDATGKNLILIFFSVSSTFFVLIFFLREDFSSNKGIIYILIIIGKIVLFFSIGVIFAALIFTLGTYLSGRVDFLLSPLFK